MTQRTPLYQRILPVLFLILLSKDGLAQRSASELELLREEEVRTQLGISGDDATKLEAALKTTRPGKEFFDPYIKRITEAAERGDAEEKAKIQKEMFEAQAAKMEEMKSQALELLSDTQKQKLRGIFLRSAGIRVFTDPRVAKDYELTEVQAKAFAELGSAYRTAARSLGEASDEERDKFGDEWKAKFMAALSPQQKARFDKESAYGAEPAIASAPAAEQTTPGAVRPPEMNQPPEGEQVVGSFGGGSPGEAQRVSEFRFNFRYEAWERVLQMYADGAGLTLDLNQIPPGTFSHYDDNAYTARQTLDILNGYLHRKGYVMIENDGFLIVMNVDNGVPPYLIRDVSEEELLKVGREMEVGNNELANFRMSVDGMDTAKVAQEVEALLGPLGSLVALTDSQLLIITDVGSNLRRIHGFLTAAMSKARPDALMFTIYHLKNMDAEEAEIAVRTQFGMRQNVVNVSAAAVEQARSQAFASRTRGGAPQPQPQPQAAAASTGPEIQIAADMRLNSLLVTGTATQHQLVETILTALDVSEDASGNPLSARRKGSYLEVYTVRSSSAREVTKTLTAMNLPGVNVVNEDDNAGTIHIVATERQHEEVASLIRQLDGGGVSGSVAVIQLAQMDPLSAAATLRSLFYADGDSAPTIETDLYGRRLIVRGNIDQITQIKQVLADLGEDGTGVRERGDGGLVRRFSLQGRNPEQFLKVLQQQWEAQQETKINIVVPNQASPIGSRRTVDEEFDRPNEEQKTDAEPPLSFRARPDAPQASTRWNEWKQPSNLTAARKATVSINPRSGARIDNAEQAAKVGARSRLITTSQTSSSSPAAEVENEAKAPPESERSDWDPQDRSRNQVADSDVFIQLLGDDLVLSASNEDTLDELEDLLDFLHQSLPMKPEYTVVYLKAADALEAADMLSQFFPSSSVASTSMTTGGSLLGDLGGSLSGMGSSLMDVTGLSGLGVSSSTLKIFPDIRTNSLFLTGPQSMIKDAIAFLTVLDSNDIPESLKDMQPRQIMVKHAEVNDVANLLRDVFKPYMEAQNGGKQQQQNPLAMMFGGGGSGGRGGSNEATQVRMTLGIDAQTSILTVNSSQDIFDEVEQVVLNMDEAVQSARPMVLPIQLKNADAVVIQQMLSSLMPRVSITSSRTNSTSTPPSSSGASPGGGDSGANKQAEEAMSREIQNRIRERMQSGAAGGSPGGGRQGFGGGGIPQGFGGGRGAGGGRTGGGRGR